MALTFTKTKVQKVSKAVAMAAVAEPEEEVSVGLDDLDDVELLKSTSALMGLVDELADMLGKEAETLAQIKALQASLAPIKALREQIQEELDKLDLDPDAEDSIKTDKAILTFGKKGTKREIEDMEAVRELMGDDLFIKVATVPLKAIDDYLNPEQKATVLKTSRTDRTLKVIAK